MSTVPRAASGATTFDGGGFVGDDKTVVVGGDGSEQQQHAMPKAVEEKGKQKEKLKREEVDRGSIADTEGVGVSAKY